MAKPLAGKRWFEALGRRHESLGMPHLTERDMRNWPLWAQIAYCWGRMDEMPNYLKGADYEK